MLHSQRRVQRHRVEILLRAGLFSGAAALQTQISAPAVPIRHCPTFAIRPPLHSTHQEAPQTTVSMALTMTTQLAPAPMCRLWSGHPPSAQHPLAHCPSLRSPRQLCLSSPSLLCQRRHRARHHSLISQWSRHPPKTTSHPMCRLSYGGPTPVPHLMARDEACMKVGVIRMLLPCQPILLTSHCLMYMPAKTAASTCLEALRLQPRHSGQRTQLLMITQHIMMRIQQTSPQPNAR